MNIRITFISLGCDKNLVDSEKMLSGMQDAGYIVTDNVSEADVAVINTCCFIHDAKQESIDTILETAGFKTSGKLKYLIVTGCLASRYSKEITEAIPEVDAVLSSSASDELDAVIRKLVKGSLEYKIIEKNKDHEPEWKSRRLHNTLKNYAYLKIADGCNKHCTYCVIPGIKGKYRSSDFESVVAEAKDAVAKGKNELILIAQETTLYGTDLYGKKRISELLRTLNEIDGLEWIRLMYCYPEEIDDELVSALKECDKVCKYIDMPIQHISDTVLKNMGRRTNGRDIKNIIKLLRKEIPDISIRTSLITGFPGETEEDHEALLKFVKEIKLDRVGVFTYSKEENTPAAKMKPQILKKTKEKRRKELMLAQQEVVFGKNRELEGTTQKVVIEGFLPEEGVYVGRTFRDAPDVDGCCFVQSDRELVLGDFENVKITGSNGYDLVGICIE